MRPLSRLSLLTLVCAVAGGSASAQFSFQTTANAVGQQPHATAVADLDGDGDFDLAVSSDAPDKVSLLFNNGDGTFARPLHVFLRGGTSPHTPVAGDLDGDGDIDLAVSLKNVDAVQVIVQMRGGIFALGPAVFVGAQPRDLAIGDLDKDFDKDLVVSNRAGNSVSVLRNEGGLSFSVATYPAGLDPREIALGDVTGDGLLDVAVAAHDSDAIIVLRGTGNAVLASHATLSTAPRSPSGVTIARLDANVTFDIAVSADNNNQDFAIVFLNNRGGSFGAGVAYLQLGRNGTSIVANDFDLDGDRDLAISNEDTNDVVVLPNTGNGTFAAPQRFRVGVQPTQLVSADLDRSGGADLVTANEGDSNLTVLLNEASAPGTAFCFGDGSLSTPCPCVPPYFVPTPSGAPDAGCANSFNLDGAKLSATGATSPDTVVLRGEGLTPVGFSFFIVGDGSDSNGVSYGDGVRCAGGSFVRFGAQNASGGEVTYPNALQPLPLSMVGSSPPGSALTRYYQTFYRSAVSKFCNPSTSNVSSAYQITW